MSDVHVVVNCRSGEEQYVPAGEREAAIAASDERADRLAAQAEAQMAAEQRGIAAQADAIGELRARVRDGRPVDADLLVRLLGLGPQLG